VSEDDSGGEGEGKPGWNATCRFMLSVMLGRENPEGTQEDWAEGTALRSAWHMGDVLIIIFTQRWKGISLRGLNVWI